MSNSTRSPEPGASTHLSVDDLLDLVVDEQSTHRHTSPQRPVVADVASIRVKS